MEASGVAVYVGWSGGLSSSIFCSSDSPNGESETRSPITEHNDRHNPTPHGSPKLAKEKTDTVLTVAAIALDIAVVSVY